MQFLTIQRIIKAGWNNFWRNRWLSLATISVMFLAIFSASVLVLLNVIGQNILITLQNKVDVSVYIKQEVGEQEINKMRSDLMFLGEVKNVSYVSSEEALAKFKERHQENPTLMESIAELGNPLLPALNIEANNASQYDAIISFLENGKYKESIEKINYKQSKPLIEKLSNFSDKVKRGGLLISIILAVVAGLVAFNTIRLAMYNFKNEVEVMRLVGASDWYIRGPFLVEGILYGAFAALSALIILTPLLYFFSPKISILAPDSNIFKWYTDNFFLFFLLQLILGIVLGGASSIVAIRKYLRV
jgi:cell division transport system permease protein